MLTFFRKIRKGLLSEGTGSKPVLGGVPRYLPYAIGEILLVMIGILLALQVNNWNQNRQNQELEKKYLSNIIADLEFDISSFNSFIDFGDDHLTSINFFLESFKQNRVLQDSVIINHLNQLPFILSFDPKRSTFDDMQSSGNLNLIKDDEIRIQVTDYYSLTENIKTDVTLTNNYLLRNVFPIVFDTKSDLNSVLKHSRITADFMDIVEVDAFSDSRFNMDNSQPQRIELINSLTFQNQINAMNSRWFMSGSREAEKLKEQLIAYRDGL